ncbi:MAG TPA: hypothetical protein VNO34_04210 [Actinomycetota bacterium]|nr:hypothetical protein [Actinomycetota bacterium]
MTPATGPPVTPPQANVTVELGEYYFSEHYFRVPEGVTPGEHAVLLENEGVQATSSRERPASSRTCSSWRGSRDLGMKAEFTVGA